MKQLWILGAPDPEMESIEALLREQGETVAYAAVDTKRVHPGNAYKATGIVGASDGSHTVAAGRAIAAIECGGFFSSWPDVVVIDHHRPGDPGYGRPPQDYWLASSMGQVMDLLHPGCSRFHHDGSPYLAAGYGLDEDTPYLLIAAADHCLPAAYRGECYGVSPDALMAWRAESRAKFQGRSIEAVLADVAAAREALRSAPLVPGLPGRVADFSSGTIPELPEAAAREGIAFLAVLDERGRRKVVLQVASPKQIEIFLCDYPAQEKYGDPARGFAGGYP